MKHYSVGDRVRVEPESGAATFDGTVFTHMHGLVAVTPDFSTSSTVVVKPERVTMLDTPSDNAWIMTHQELLEKYIQRELFVITERSENIDQDARALLKAVVRYAAAQGLVVEVEWFDAYILWEGTP